MKKALPKTNRPTQPKGGVKKDIRVTVKNKLGNDMDFTISHSTKKKRIEASEFVEEVPPKKKKKKPSTELVPVVETPPEVKGKKTTTRISKLTSKNMRSILGDSAESIQQLLEDGDSDNATSLMIKRMLQALVDLVPYAEHNVRKSKGQRGVYQINSLMSSIRELLQDLQSMQDRGAMGQNLAEKVLRPAFLDIAMMLVKEMAELSSDVKELLTVEDYNNKFRPLVLASRERVGRYVQDRYKEAEVATCQFLQR